jgi:hypothetical protein
MAYASRSCGPGMLLAPVSTGWSYYEYSIGCLSIGPRTREAALRLSLV